MRFIEGLNWICILGVLVAVETQIGNGTMSLSNMVPEAWIPFVKAWSANLGSIGALIMSAGVFGKQVSSNPSPINTSSVVRALLVAFALSMFLAPIAFAADLTLPVRAPAIALPDPGSACTPTSCSGFYVGGQLAGVGSNADIIGNGVNGSVFAGGGIPMATVGYQYASGNWFFGAEGAVGWQVSTKANIGGVTGNENGFISYQIGKVGGNLAGLFGNSAAPIAIPPKLANALISPYVLLGAVERPFASGWASGAGATFDIGPHTFVDIKYMYVNYGPSSNGAFNMKSENLLTAGVNYKF
jgi:opacity protein-like surface antigen